MDEKLRITAVRSLKHPVLSRSRSVEPRKSNSDQEKPKKPTNGTTRDDSVKSLGLFSCVESCFRSFRVSNRVAPMPRRGKKPSRIELNGPVTTSADPTCRKKAAINSDPEASSSNHAVTKPQLPNIFITRHDNGYPDEYFYDPRTNRRPPRIAWTAIRSTVRKPPWRSGFGPQQGRPPPLGVIGRSLAFEDIYAEYSCPDSGFDQPTSFTE